MAEEHGEVLEDDELDAERAARRRAALAHVRQYPDPVLRMQAKEVTQFDDDLRVLVERMKFLVVEAHGLGLAGNQVGSLQRVFVFRRADEEDPTAVVNPRITKRSDELATDDEGCLSLQGVIVPVERHVGLTLEAQDVDGSPLRFELEDIDARVVQHEIDHLDAVLILDRTDKESRREAMKTLRTYSLV